MDMFWPVFFACQGIFWLGWFMGHATGKRAGANAEFNRQVETRARSPEDVARRAGAV